MMREDSSEGSEGSEGPEGPKRRKHILTMATIEKWGLIRKGARRLVAEHDA